MNIVTIFLEQIKYNDEYSDYIPRTIKYNDEYSDYIPRTNKI